MSAFSNNHAQDDQLVIPALRQQLGLDENASAGVYFSAEEIDVDDYDHIIICMSGGKDSIACLLKLKEQGVDQSKIELWHHEVDGREGSHLMDWQFMPDYNRKLAEAMGVPLYFSWLEGGFEGEMLKANAYSKPHRIEKPEGLMVLDRDTRRAKPATRRKFPQLSASLQTRWCSSALKIDVGRRSLNNQERFNGKRVLFITGERRQESGNRARYNQFEPHACDRRDGRKARHVDSYRAVLGWSEDRVWDILERHRINPPVPYRLGWTRSSCMTCIYNGPRIWATLCRHFPSRVQQIVDYENEFGVTISRKKIDVKTIGQQAAPLEIDDVEALLQAIEADYALPIVLPADATWTLPPGAFGSEGCGSA